jgi:leucine dehydrogenase
MTLESKNSLDFTNNKVFGQPSFDNHEQIVFCNDKETGLKAIIGIHDTTLGPALGGTRMWNYTNEWEALNDVLRLSRGMSYKSAIAGLGLGGGKAVIIGDAKTQKTPELMKKFGSFVHSLSGRYITAEDVGMKTEDMDIVRSVTPHVTGVSESLGGSGNPSPVTAFGVYMGMKAAAQYAYKNNSLAGRKIWVQGIGNVGETLVKYLVDEQADVYITDMNHDRELEICNKYNVKILTDFDPFAANIEIYAPCALGASVNDETIHKLKVKIIAGAANNQLANEEIHGKLLTEKGIVYAPDFVINAGGIINVYSEIEKYNSDEAMKRTENIYNTTLELLQMAENNKITTSQAALQMAQEIISNKKLANIK